MKTLKDIRFAYWMTVGEKAIKKGDTELAKKCKKKIRELMR